MTMAVAQTQLKRHTSISRKPLTGLIDVDKIHPVSAGSSVVTILLLALPLIAAVAFFGTIGLFVQHPAEHHCYMTYMYVPPRFIKIPITQKRSSSFEVVLLDYDLYIYEEGWPKDEPTPFEKVKFAGVPILFVPGTGGSYKQARSVGSVLLVKAFEQKWPFYFDIFAVDFNEEYTGIYGPSIDDQTRFLANAIDRIFQLYAERTPDGQLPPKTLFIYAHSLGGMVVKNLYTLPDFDASRIRAIILLSTPVAEPAVRLDRQMMQIYERVSRVWSGNESRATNNLTIVSVNGGHLDLLIRQDATVLRRSGIVADLNFVNVATTGVTRVWSSADHLSIVWCRELNLALSRFIEESVDIGANQISADSRKIFLAARGQFVVPSLDVYIGSRGLIETNSLLPLSADELLLVEKQYADSIDYIVQSSGAEVRIAEHHSMPIETDCVASSKHVIIADLIGSAVAANVTNFHETRILLQALPANELKNFSMYVCLKTYFALPSAARDGTFKVPENCRRVRAAVDDGKFTNGTSAFLMLPNVRGATALTALVHLDLSALAHLAGIAHDTFNASLRNGLPRPSIVVAFHCLHKEAETSSKSCSVRMQYDDLLPAQPQLTDAERFSNGQADLVLPDFYHIISNQLTGQNVFEIKAKRNPLVQIDISALREPWQSVRWEIQLNPARCFAPLSRSNQFRSWNALPSVVFSVRQHPLPHHCSNATQTSGEEIDPAKSHSYDAGEENVSNNFDDVRLAPFLCRRRHDSGAEAYDLVALGYTVPSSSNMEVDDSSLDSQYKTKRTLTLILDNDLTETSKKCINSVLHIKYSVSWWFMVGEIFRYASSALPSFFASVCLYTSGFVRLVAVQRRCSADESRSLRWLASGWPGTIAVFTVFHAGEHALRQVSSVFIPVEQLSGIRDGSMYFIVSLLWFSSTWFLFHLMLAVRRMLVSLCKTIVQSNSTWWRSRFIQILAKCFVVVVLTCAVISIWFCSSIAIIINAVLSLLAGIMLTGIAQAKKQSRLKNEDFFWSRIVYACSMKQCVGSFFAIPALVFYLNSSRIRLSPDPLFCMAVAGFLQQFVLGSAILRAKKKNVVVDGANGTVVGKPPNPPAAKSCESQRRRRTLSTVALVCCCTDILLAFACVWYAKQSIYRIYDAFTLSFIVDAFIVILLNLSPEG